MRTSYGRLGALSGILAAAFFIAGLVLPGSPPKADESTAQIASFLADKRDSILAGDVLFAIGTFFFIAFAAAVAHHLRGSGDEADDALGSMMRIGAAAGVALLLAGVAVINGITFKSVGSGAYVRAFWDTGNDIVVVAGVAIAAFFAAAALANARSHAMPSWMTSLGAIAALLQIVSVVALFAKSGFFATGGAFGFIVPAVSVVWILGASALLARHHAAAPSGQPASGSPSPAH